MNRPAPPRTDTDELRELIAWLNSVRGGTSFADLAAAATGAGMTVSASTLCRALRGHSPTRYAVRAFARGAAADEAVAERLWVAARAAAHRPPGPAPAPYKPGWITTWAGLTAALDRLRNQAGRPSCREIAVSRHVAGLLNHSAVNRILTGRRNPTQRELAALAAALDAGEPATRALLAARNRILAGSRPPAVYPCDIVERADEQRQDDEARPWLAACNLLPCDDELDQLEQQGRDAEKAAGPLPDLRAELLAILARTRPPHPDTADDDGGAGTVASPVREGQVAAAGSALLGGTFTVVSGGRISP